MYYLIKNGIKLRQVVVVSKAGWAYEQVITDLSFDDHKKAEEVASAIGAEVQFEEQLKVAA